MTHAPPHLPESPFTYASGLAAGLTVRQLRSAALHRPTKGVRVITPPQSLEERARAIAVALPQGAAFSHLTAALLHGLPLSYAMEEDERLHVIRHIDHPQLRRQGVVGHRALHPRQLLVVSGLPVVGLADTWVDLGELVGRGKPVGLDDLIVVGDACATRLQSVAPLRTALARRVRPRGKNTLLEALEYIRVGSLSAPETQCRLMFVRVGLPEPVPNRPITASWDPKVLLGVGDLVWELFLPDGRVLRVIGEYQGAQFHSGDEQRARDGVRRKGLEGDGWTVHEIWADQVNTTDARRATVARFAASLEIDPRTLDLSQGESRFFSRHAMDLAIQRDVRRRSRGW